MAFHPPRQGPGHFIFKFNDWIRTTARNQYDSYSFPSTQPPSDDPTFLEPKPKAGDKRADQNATLQGIEDAQKPRHPANFRLTAQSSASTSNLTTNLPARVAAVEQPPNVHPQGLNRQNGTPQPQPRAAPRPRRRLSKTPKPNPPHSQLTTCSSLSTSQVISSTTSSCTPSAITPALSSCAPRAGASHSGTCPAPSPLTCWNYTSSTAP